MWGMAWGTLSSPEALIFLPALGWSFLPKAWEAMSSCLRSESPMLEAHFELQNQVLLPMPILCAEWH